MKMIKILLALFLFTLPVFAQEETLFDGTLESGGYGGPVIRVTQIDKTSALMFGGKGEWIINHTFCIGGGGYGLTSNIGITAPDGKDLRMELGYGGLILEYIYNSNKYIHFTAQTLIGGGSVSWRDNNNYYWNDNSNYNNNYNRYGQDEFFVIEPGANVELNLVKWFRMELGVSYRFISGLYSKLTYQGNTIKTLESKDLSGISGTLTFKFGVF